MCPFANGKPDVPARYREMPEAAAAALLLEEVALAFNPRMTLYRDRSLRSVLVADRQVEPFVLLYRKLAEQPWGLYRVRRVYVAKGVARRSAERLMEGTREQARKALEAAAAEQGQAVEVTAHSPRFYALRRTPEAYPTAEEMYVVAPAVVQQKAGPNFERTWTRVVPSRRSCTVRTSGYHVRHVYPRQGGGT
jgi:hypothetical protein